ncbi:hypothetical protein BN1183_BA_01740 [Pantoea ananatis]|nr:hypothetical protein BN1183_BA_01740 [Pantoea ananatis]
MWGTLALPDGKPPPATFPVFQGRNNVGGMPVLLCHAVTSPINFTPSAVRSQRGASISAAK